MSTSIVTLTPREVPWQPLSDDIVIGRDILELLSSSMYVDPMTIYREYVQNAADAIDEARSHNQLGTDPGRVNIRIDTATRSVKITDNGAGIPHEDFVKRLTAFGASKKRGRGARGFRGVGRLAGIAYCQELVFRSRTIGERRVSELRWDCRKLKTLLRSNDGHQAGLREAVSHIVELRSVAPIGWPERFFEVEMRGIVRHRNDQLLSATAINTYLSQVAPVPFRDDFPLRDSLLAHVGPHVRLGDLQITIGEGSETIRRPHGPTLETSPGEHDPFTDAELLTIPSIDGGLAAVGWLLHHGYSGALPVSCNVRGLRVRCGNIQIGDERLFEELFPESRFNAWSVGELHVIDERIVPNGRRDHFEHNVHYDNLLTHLTPAARDIARRCRTSSMFRKWVRDFELQEIAIRERASILKQGAQRNVDRQRLAEEIRARLVSMSSIAAKELLPTETAKDLKKRIHRLERDIDGILNGPATPGALAKLARPTRHAYQHIIGLIYECSASQTNAKLLVDKILARLA